MKRKVGLWIDHRQALIVAITDTGEETKLIVSGVEKQLGHSDSIRSTTPYGSQQGTAADIRDRKFMGHLNIYYDAVIASIRDAESILIFGPGEAKGELKERLDRNKLGGHIVGIESIDKMTDNQVAVKVRQYFQEHSARK
ncbi:MAG: hypothetical protein NTZ78_15165 [Candidatus Aureabacteria bacterium]|nr:hypothetical protein [Candidatus Auribacterota bacterium]